MSPEQIGNYLRSHRRTSGLSQRELAGIVGSLTRFQVARHEQSAAIPVLMIAIAYEVVFQVPLKEIFSGLYRTIEAKIESELSTLEEKLHESTAKGRKAEIIARKLEWLWERRNPETL
jgi:DNA-binding XRE family transcriptional regulator